MKYMTVFVCENSIEGIFTGVYEAWDSKLGHDNIRLKAGEIDNYELFVEYKEVKSDVIKAKKVSRTICKKLGWDSYMDICYAAMSPAQDKANAIYHTIVLGINQTNDRRIMERLSNPFVARIFALARASGNEANHYLGFLRFAELSNGILWAEFHPENYIIELVADHFTNRLPQENWMIYDHAHGVIAMHQKLCQYVLTDDAMLDISALESYSETELLYQKLWKGFFDRIAIEDRKNAKLQSQNIPKRFWNDVVELKR